MVLGLCRASSLECVKFQELNRKPCFHLQQAGDEFSLINKLMGFPGITEILWLALYVTGEQFSALEQSFRVLEWLEIIRLFCGMNK